MTIRRQKVDLELGDGGEGYIGEDEWCYNCGGDGHLGDVSALHDYSSCGAIILS